MKKLVTFALAATLATLGGAAMAKDHHVRAYVKKDGTHVRAHRAANPGNHKGCAKHQRCRAANGRFVRC